MTETQSIWITTFEFELGKRVAQFKNGGDICHDQVLIVLKQLDKYVGKYPNPQDAVKAMRFTARMNFGRDEAIQRGEGVRRTRIVGQFPMHNTKDGDSIAVDLVDHNAIDPAMQAADRDECRRAVHQLRPVVAAGVALTAVFGYDQGEAAKQIDFGRTHLSRAMNQSKGRLSALSLNQTLLMLPTVLVRYLSAFEYRDDNMVQSIKALLPR